MYFTAFEIYQTYTTMPLILTTPYLDKMLLILTRFWKFFFQVKEFGHRDDPLS